MLQDYPYGRGPDKSYIGQSLILPFGAASILLGTHVRTSTLTHSIVQQARVCVITISLYSFHSAQNARQCAGEEDR